MSFVNNLSREKQIEVIAALCEGVGIRTAARLTGFADSAFTSFGFRRETVTKRQRDTLFANLRSVLSAERRRDVPNTCCSTKSGVSLTILHRAHRDTGRMLVLRRARQLGSETALYAY